MPRRIRTNQQTDELDQAWRDLVDQAIQDDQPVPWRDGPATAGGDPVRLRGIPAIGRNVTGAIRGTDPEREATRP